MTKDRSAFASATAKVVEEAVLICEIPSPTGHEKRRAEFVAEKFRDTGWLVDIDEVGNVIALPARETHGGRTIMVAAHLDTVFSSVRDISVVRDGNILKAPGIGDNSLGVAGLLYLAREFAQSPGTHALALVATVGEEGLGNLRGATQAVASLKPDEMIALEGGGAECLIYSGPASVRARISVITEGGHSWEDRGRENAISELLRAIAVLEAAAPAISDSFNIGLISGGSGISAIAAQAQADIEFRALEISLLDQALVLLEDLAQPDRSPPSLSVEILGVRPGGKTSQYHPLACAAREARRKAGLPLAKSSCVSTDANAGMAADVPSICVGLAGSKGAHTPAEQVDISKLSLSLDALSILTGMRTESHS